MTKGLIPCEKTSDKTCLIQVLYHFQMNWQQYLNSVFGVTTYRITPDEPIIVFAPEFLSKLSDMIIGMNQTDEGKK